MSGDDAASGAHTLQVLAEGPSGSGYRLRVACPDCDTWGTVRTGNRRAAGKVFDLMKTWHAGETAP